MRQNAGAKLKREITNYFAAETFYHDHAKRGRDAKLAHNTIIRPTWRDVGAPEARQRENGFEIVLHHTPILTFWAGGTLTLNTGGYETVTTKARLNEVLQPIGLTIWQKKGQWYVAEIGSEKDALKFFDGMEVRVEFNHEHSLRSRGFLKRNAPEKLTPDTYAVEVDEGRGKATLSVIEKDGHVLFSISRRPGEDFWLVEKGWMRHDLDYAGLTAYLVNEGKVARKSKLLSRAQAEAAWKR